MNWYPNLNTATQTTDNFISKSVYNGVSTQGEGIDLRQEMHWILYGKQDFPIRNPKGHWVVFRHFDTTKKSVYYSERTHEGVGGPPYQYTDTLLRMRKVPRRINLDAQKISNIVVGQWLYYMEWTVNPSVMDNIFELNWNDHSLVPNINTVTFREKLVIKGITDYRLDNGNIQYWMANCEHEEIAY